MHPLAYAFIAMAAMFGGVAAFVLLWKPPPPAPVIIVQAPSGDATTKPESTAGAATKPSETEATDTLDAGADAAARPPPAGGAAPKPGDAKAAAGPAASANIDMSGFGTQANVEGPAAAPEAPQNTGGGQLSAGEINGVVSGGQALIRRKCWQPALESRAGTGPNARVNVNIVIGPTGSVQSASASGAENDYPGLSSCIASRIKGWQFPASGGTTPVKIPFFFAAQ